MFGDRQGESVSEALWLPIARSRWRARRGAAALGLLGAGIATWTLWPERLELVTTVALVLGLAWWLARFERAHRVLLRWSLRGGGDRSASLSALEDLAYDARFDARVHACLVASVAELELRRGDTLRARRLFDGLRRRGWSPRELVGGSLASSGPAQSAAATMAALEALSTEPEAIEPRLLDLERSGRRWATLLARAILLLRGGRSQEAVALLDRRLAAASQALPADQLAELRTVHAFARAAAGRDPYRGSSSRRATLGQGGRPSGSQRWLTESWPALRAFLD